MLVYKASPSKLESGIVQTAFSNHDGIKLEIYTRRKMKIHTYIEIEHTLTTKESKEKSLGKLENRDG